MSACDQFVVNFYPLNPPQWAPSRAPSGGVASTGLCTTGRTKMARSSQYCPFTLCFFHSLVDPLPLRLVRLWLSSSTTRGERIDLRNSGLPEELHALNEKQAQFFLIAFPMVSRLGCGRGGYAPRSPGLTLRYCGQLSQKRVLVSPCASSVWCSAA